MSFVYGPIFNKLNDPSLTDNKRYSLIRNSRFNDRQILALYNSDGNRISEDCFSRFPRTIKAYSSIDCIDSDDPNIVSNYSTE